MLLWALAPLTMKRNLPQQTNTPNRLTSRLLTLRQAIEHAEGRHNLKQALYDWLNENGIAPQTTNSLLKFPKKERGKAVSELICASWKIETLPKFIQRTLQEVFDRL